MLKAIHAQESREAADRKARAIIDDLRAARMNTAADLVEGSVSETLTYYAFPDIHWQKIRTNNPLERIMKEISRRNSCCWSVPRRSMMPQPGGARCDIAARMVRQMLHEYATAISTAGHANRGRRLIKCAKESGHFRQPSRPNGPRPIVQIGRRARRLCNA